MIRVSEEIKWELDDEYSDHTVMYTINFLSYIQTHEVSVERALSFQPLINQIARVV